MARYTKFETLRENAAVETESVWFREQGARLTVTFVNDWGFTQYWLGSRGEITEEMAREMFNLEMRVYGWVSTERIAA